ncbi:Fungal-trans domain-containing protein [Fusarium falciforme]|uniref:Fungal-trans domain-containing protein n=1 Tax=Fusarium falciforme TaxID=195108 RepID=UPI0022FFD42D|nr:Fungal-trans domain-containing protein [Fusarium falciforme]WAO96727.1 Fungal-trans domain-containing protein [Fusarium falciforme]
MQGPRSTYIGQIRSPVQPGLVVCVPLDGYWLTAHRRKTRCSGKYPCALCFRLRLDCKYTASYRRGRLPSIEMDTDAYGEHVGDAPRATEEQLRGSDPPNETPQMEEHIPSPVSIEARTFEPSKPERGASTQSSRNSPEPAPIDRQGHYVGPASGASFLLRVQRKLQQHRSASSSDGSIFTFGDLPLPEFDTRFLILPPRSEADALLCRYFEFSSATHRFLHRPTIESWLQELYETHGRMRNQTDARSRTALLFMVFAHAENYPKSKAGTVDPSSSARFFSAAEDQLSAEKGAIRLTSIQARLAQCLYLLSHSRLNHCWSLFGTTAHLMLALGIHRKSRVDASSHPDYVDLECRKRTFWCAYNLDTYLSAALGRPRTFHDDDIDQELPLCVDDNRLARGQPAPSPLGTTQSIMSGSIAHIKLSRIVAKILRDLYGIRQPSTESQYKLAAKYAKEIDNWHSGISYLVDTDGIDPSLFQPIFLRQRNVLNLACWHAQILVHRPFLLNNFASLANLGTTRNSRSRQNSELTHEHVQGCLEAAMNIVAKIDDLHSNGLLYNTFWFSHYFAFSAVVMLYVYAIQQRHAPPETYLPAFHAATKCQAQITSIAIPGSLGQRYGVVLQELRVELLRHNTNLLDLGSTHGQGAASGSASMRNGEEGLLGSYTNQDILDLGPQGIGFAPGAEDITGQLGLAGQDGLGFSEHSPGSSIVQMTGWGQFESLVTGGVGGIEAFLDGHMGGWNLGMGEQLDT